MARLIKPPSKAWIAARHEAAHAVVGLALGISIRGARVREAGKRSWITHHESLGEHTVREPNRDYFGIVRDHAVLAMAGSAMEFLLSGDEPACRDDNPDDWNTVHELLSHELRLGRVPLALEREALWARARELVAMHRCSIDRVASVMDHVGEISGESLERLALIR